MIQKEPMKYSEEQWRNALSEVMSRWYGPTDNHLSEEMANLLGGLATAFRFVSAPAEWLARNPVAMKLSGALLATAALLGIVDRAHGVNHAHALDLESGAHFLGVHDNQVGTFQFADSLGLPDHMASTSFSQDNRLALAFADGLGASPVDAGWNFFTIERHGVGLVDRPAGTPDSERPSSVSYMPLVVAPDGSVWWMADQLADSKVGLINNVDAFLAQKDFLAVPLEKRNQVGNGFDLVASGDDRPLIHVDIIHDAAGNPISSLTVFDPTQEGVGCAVLNNGSAEKVSVDFTPTAPADKPEVVPTPDKALHFEDIFKVDNPIAITESILPNGVAMRGYIGADESAVVNSVYAPQSLVSEMLMKIGLTYWNEHSKIDQGDVGLDQFNKMIVDLQAGRIKGEGIEKMVVHAPFFDLSDPASGYQDMDIVFFPGTGTQLPEGVRPIFEVRQIYATAANFNQATGDIEFRPKDETPGYIKTYKDGNGYSTIIDGTTLVIVVYQNPAVASLNGENLTLISAADLVSLYRFIPDFDGESSDVRASEKKDAAPAREIIRKGFVVR